MNLLRSRFELERKGIREEKKDSQSATDDLGAQHLPENGNKKVAALFPQNIP